MKQHLTLRRVGKTSLYCIIPAWFVHMRDLSDGDCVLFMPEDVTDNGAVRLQFVKATHEETLQEGACEAT
jgi:hypothetical protein